MARRLSPRLSVAMKYRFRGASGGDAPPPPAAPSISAFAFSSNPIDEDVSGTFTGTIGGGTLTGWSLDPGDGSAPYTGSGSSISQAHTYADAGTYDAILTATGPGGSDFETVLDIVVDAAGAVAWYDWATEQPFTSMTETRRNISGGTLNKAPISFQAVFHPGEIPTTKTLQLRDPSSNIIATTHWQWDSRVTYPDGSLKSCWVRVLGPSSLADEASCTYTVEAITGSWPAETDSRDTTSITGSTDFQVILNDVRLIGNSQYSDTQALRGSGDFDFQLNRSLGVAGRTTKVAAGPIFSRWRTWEKLQPVGGGTVDTELWCECWAEVWYDPDTTTIIHRMADPLVYNGWARVMGQAKAFKIKVVDGASTLRDFATTLDLTAASFQAPEYTFTSNATDWSTFDFRMGNVVKISGSPPSGFTSGKIYPVSRYNGGTDNGIDPEIHQNPYLILGKLYSSGTANMRCNAYDPQSPGTGGGTFTLTGYTMILDAQAIAIRDGDGEPFWMTGGEELKPYWTRAERIRRFQTGHIITVSIEEVNSSFSDFLGLSSNAPKNTSLIPEHNQKHRYTPGGTILHRGQMEAAGEYSEGGIHLNEISLRARDVLCDPASTVAPWDRMLRQSAAEAICFQRLNCAENSTDGSGNEYALPIILNNGADKAGTQYSGAGPCRPTAFASNDGSSTGIRNPGYGVGANQENEMSHWSYGGNSGSHASKDFVWTFAMYGLGSDLRMIQHQYTRHMVTAGIGPTTSAPLYGTTKTHDGVTYYCVTSLGTNNVTQQSRSHIGKNHMLANCLWTPDNDPLGPYFKDIIEDNVAYMEAIYDDPDVIGTRAKIVGPTIALDSGAQQTWHLQRNAIANLLALKRSGITAPNNLKYWTALARWFVGHPESGPGAKQAFTGFCGTIAAFSYFDKVKTTTDPTDTDPQVTLYRFLDDATWDATVATDAVGDISNADSDIKFLTTSLLRLTVWSPVAATHALDDGDQVMFITSSLSTVPAGVSYQTRYYVYDKTFVSGTTYTYKLSSTPGPSYTQVTWSIGADLNFTKNNMALYFQARRAGSEADGLVDMDQGADLNRDYLNNMLGPIGLGYTMFGPAFQTLADAKAALDAFEASCVTQGCNFYDGSKANGSWAMHKPYGPGAT